MLAYFNFNYQDIYSWNATVKGDHFKPSLHYLDWKEPLSTPTGTSHSNLLYAVIERTALASYISYLPSQLQIKSRSLQIALFVTTNRYVSPKLYESLYDYQLRNRRQDQRFITVQFTLEWPQDWFMSKNQHTYRLPNVQRGINFFATFSTISHNFLLQNLDLNCFKSFLLQFFCSTVSHHFH